MPDETENVDRLRAAVDRKNEQARARAEEQSIASSAREQDDQSIRAKSTGHKKKTADKWNQ